MPNFQAHVDMNYLSGALRYVAGGESDSKDVVPRLIDRIKTSALPQDRRAAITALTSAAKLSPSRQILVGEQAIRIVYAVLEQDKDYDDTLKATLDLLIAICGTLDPPPADQLPVLLGEAAEGISEQERFSLFEQKSARAAATNVDVFLGLPNAVSLLLELLEKTDFYVKFGTIELLTAMAANSRQTLQMAILEAPHGVPRICDLLDDNHRHIRSNAVLLLSTLCDESPEICKIVAYGGVLEKLFALIESVSGESRVSVAGIIEDDDDEENLEAAIIVQDVLLVLRNLINGANTTRTFFRDTGCLPRLVGVVKKAAADANMLSDRLKSARMKVAVEKQARKNLIVVMNCISGLVREGDNESRLVKGVLATTNLFILLGSLAFNVQLYAGAEPEKLPENALQVRVAALKTIAVLARGHDDFRTMFSSSSFSVGNGEATNAQVAALRAMMTDSSSAVRVASYSALRESFVVDAGLDLPSSTLLNAITGSNRPASYSISDGVPGTQRRSMSSNDLSSPGSAIQFIAESLKTALIGWPADADAAGVFYSASLVTWVVDRVQGARERLLASYVNGGSLLPQIFRVLGKLEREKGPPEVRIALFSLGCTWLYGSPSAVSAFLSSAMHLPMLVEILNSSGSRGDLAEVHVRGLAAVLLGICLQVAEGQADPANDMGFLSGGGGASVVLPRGTVVDVIRNRIGVTEFTACLEDLRASKSFSGVAQNGSLWVFADELVSMEDRAGFLSSKGLLGHDQWYSTSIVDVVNNVYKDVGARALDLLSGPTSVPVPGNASSASIAMNGHANASHELPGSDALLADSTRDEVLNSYKEFIRSQDENLNAARRQIEELSTALRETQTELDSKTNQTEAIRGADVSHSMQEASEELMAQKQALEALLEEKAADFEALSNAYAALEEDQSTQNGPPGDVSATVSSELVRLRAQNANIRDSFSAEAAKNSDLMHQATLLDSALNVKESELAAVEKEKELLRSQTNPEVAEALQWRSRAEVAEAKALSHQSLLYSTQERKKSLENRLRETERSRDESSFSVSTLEKQLSSAVSELEDIRSTRKRELQVSRESSNAVTAGAQAEIQILTAQLAEAREDATLQSTLVSDISSDQRNNFEVLKKDHQTLLASVEGLKTELLDTKSALAQWQKKGETAVASKAREAAENTRLSDLARNLDAQVQSRNDALTAQTQLSTASAARVTELERQSAELDEIRRRSEEELRALKEELANRTEQSIRLSGQLYEAEEEKIKMDEEVKRVQEFLSGTKDELAKEKEKSSLSEGMSQAGQSSIEEYELKIASLRAELETTKDALADSKDRDSLSQAQIREREAVAGNAALLEQSLNSFKCREAELTTQVDDLRQKLMSLDEAEDAKRALSAQVVSLQDSLDAASMNMKSQGLTSDMGASHVESEKQIAELRTLISEKEMRLKELESSLTGSVDQINSIERNKSDLEKQLAESEAMLSVLAAERDGLYSKCAEWERKCGEIASTYDSSIAIELDNSLKASEEKRAAVSAELASLVDACRVSEQESLEIRKDNGLLRNKTVMIDNEIQRLRKEKQHQVLESEVSNFVSAIVLKSAITAASTESLGTFSDMKRERDAALTLSTERENKLQILKANMAEVELALENNEDEMSRSVLQAAQLTELTAKIEELNGVVTERDELTHSLEVAKASVKTLNDEKEALIRTTQEVKPVAGSTESELAEEPERTGLPKRVVELEGALKDAARTVSATNQELISAQALLVELSADKTSIRNELKAAHEQIRGLNGKRSIIPNTQQNYTALSEVSEQENSVSELPADPCPTAVSTEVAEQFLATAKAEADNLRTALQRTISEADSAYILLNNIDEKVKSIEHKLRVSESSLRDSKAVEKKLGDELTSLQDSFESEKASLLGDVEVLRSETVTLRHDANSASSNFREQLLAIELAKTAQKEQFDVFTNQKDIAVENANKGATDLRAKLEESAEKLRQSSASIRLLQNSNSKYESSIEALEANVSNVDKKLKESESRCVGLDDSLMVSRQEMKDVREGFERRLLDMEDNHKQEIVEFETEIDRASEALENAERKFRNTELSLKEQASLRDSTLSVVRTELETCKEELISSNSACRRLLAEKESVESHLSEKLRQIEEALSVATVGRDNLRSLLESTSSERDAAQRALTESRAMVLKTEVILKAEKDRRALLEDENQDFLSTIASLEKCSKRVGDELTQAQLELSENKVKLESRDRLLQEQMFDNENWKAKIVQHEGIIKDLRISRAKLENEAGRLRSSLVIAESARETAEQDNVDLKAWVGDLERQATELQSAAENFEDVEQSLRDALDTQRDLLEQNGNVNEELKNEKETLASAQAEVRSEVRNRISAESSREAALKKASDLEERIRKIREEHLSNVSRSEDGIREKAQRCAELETLLASSERKVAELASVSDSLFGAKTELEEREEEIKRLKGRAENAEGRAEELELEIQRIENEVSEIRGSSTGDAYRALEAEHNELLVCLTDLEMENTMLKEELGRD